MKHSVFMIMMVLPATIMAWGFHDSMWDGTPVNCVTSKQSAMGGVWAMPSSGAASVFLNPAELSMLDGFQIKLSGAIVEWRTGLFGENDFNRFDTGMGGAGTMAFGTPISDRIAVGAGITRVADFGFNGVCTEMELIGPGLYEIYAMEIMDAHGSLWEANLGFSVTIADWLMAGFSGGNRFGSGSWEVRYDVVDPSVPDDTTDADWDESDFCFHGGLIMPFELATVGISGTNGTERYRSRIAFGLQRDFQVLNGSTLGLEFDMQSVDDDPDYGGRIFAHFQEMIPHVRSTYSLGFFRAANHHHTTPTLGTGARLDLDDVQIDVGVSWASRSRSGSVFPEPYVSRIDDAGTYYSLGLTLEL
jgi:hypothetical protein